MRLTLTSLLLSLLLMGLLCSPAFAQQLSVYSIDTEGGKALLIVTPQHESMLVDAGWPFDSRDAERIVAAARDAGVSQIDYLLVTHYHIDHVGGVPWVLDKIPVKHLIDHGPSIEKDWMGDLLYSAYERSTKGIPRTVVKPGDTIPLKGVDIKVVSAAGELLKGDPTALPHNPLCRDTATKPLENDENDQSIGFVLAYGKFRMLDLADLTWGKERDLVCPANVLGSADVFMVSHHGLDRSNSPLLVGSIKPRVAIMNNGATKGGAPSIVKELETSPGTEALWQLHAAVEKDAENAPEKFIANPKPDCRGFAIKLTATPDGAFTVTNQRNGYSATYAAR